MNPRCKLYSIVLRSLAAGSLFMLGCGDGSPKEQEKVYDIRGKVLEIDAAQKKVKLDHEDIPGLMKAMEMTLDVEDAKALEGLKAGDEVHGRLKVKAPGEYVITELHRG